MTRILLAGGAGVIGRPLVPALVAAGHEVVATTRRPERLAVLAELGATPATMDALDAASVAQVVADAAPDVILHELTDLAGGDREANARLRREGTAHLVAAARASGVDRMLVQSIAWVVPPGDTPATEAEPIEPGTPVDDMERMARELPHTTILRYGMLWGPTTWYPTAADAADIPQIGCWVHLDDVVSATVAALGWPDGTYNIVDDEPSPAGRAVSIAKARAEGWSPRHPGRHGRMGG